MRPFLALGQVVHGVMDELLNIPTDQRLDQDFIQLYENAWESVSGKKGGFTSDQQEKQFKERGKRMIERVQNHPGPIGRKAIKLKQDLPYYWISEEENLILCGRIDWLEYLEETNSVHIIDFKTGLRKEKEESLQLPIYLLLAKNTQQRPIQKMSYWYLEHDNEPEKVAIPDERSAKDRIMEVGKRMKLARQLNHFNCPEGESCKECKPYLEIIKGNGEFVGVGEFNKEVYIEKQRSDEEMSL